MKRAGRERPAGKAGLGSWIRTASTVWWVAPVTCQFDMKVTSSHLSSTHGGHPRIGVSLVYCMVVEEIWVVEVAGVVRLYSPVVIKSADIWKLADAALQRGR